MRRDEGRIVGEHGGQRAIAEAQFREDARRVSFMVVSEERFGGDLGPGPASADQLQHLGLALG